jgi:hypothetical protein
LRWFRVRWLIRHGANGGGRSKMGLSTASEILNCVCDLCIMGFRVTLFWRLGIGTFRSVEQNSLVASMATGI